MAADLQPTGWKAIKSGRRMQPAMKPNLLTTLPLLFLLAAAMSGCTSAPDAAPSTPAMPDEAPGQTVAMPVTMANGTPMTGPMWHNVTINVGWTTSGLMGPTIPYGGWDGPDCDPTQPTECVWVGRETIVPNDATQFSGTFLDTARVRPGAGANALAGTWLFTGSIVGCTGTGTVTFPYLAAPDDSPVSPNSNGEIVHGHDILGAPTNTTGLAVSDAHLDAEYDSNPVDVSVSNGHLTGYLVCQ